VPLSLQILGLRDHISAQAEREQLLVAQMNQQSQMQLQLQLQLHQQALRQQYALEEASAHARELSAIRRANGIFLDAVQQQLVAVHERELRVEKLATQNGTMLTGLSQAMMAFGAVAAGRPKMAGGGGYGHFDGGGAATDRSGGDFSTFRSVTHTGEQATATASTASPWVAPAGAGPPAL
jgi:hypothetical protein